MELLSRYKTQIKEHFLISDSGSLEVCFHAGRTAYLFDMDCQRNSMFKITTDGQRFRNRKQSTRAAGEPKTQDRFVNNSTLHVA